MGGCLYVSIRATMMQETRSIQADSHSQCRHCVNHSVDHDRRFPTPHSLPALQLSPHSATPPPHPSAYIRPAHIPPLTCCTFTPPQPRHGRRSGHIRLAPPNPRRPPRSTSATIGSAIPTHRRGDGERQEARDGAARDAADGCCHGGVSGGGYCVYGLFWAGWGHFGIGTAGGDGWADEGDRRDAIGNGGCSHDEASRVILPCFSLPAGLCYLMLCTVSST